MSPELLFSLSFPLAAPFWLLMIFAPGWRWTRRIAASPWIMLGPLLIYVAAVLPALSEVLPVVTDPSIDGVAELLSTPAGAAAGWAHFIAFDLFVGRWIYLESRERGIHPLITSPVLLVTILLGPVGALLHLMLRHLTRRGDASARPAPAEVGSAG